MRLPRSISENRQLLLKKKYSARELTQAYLENIYSHDKNLNSFITITERHALKKAKEIDKKIAKNPKSAEKLPLLGVVTAFKDLFLTKGIKTTAASNVLNNFTPAYSSTVYELLLGAGAIIIGKTNCDAWAHGASGENSDFGATKNPWNTKFVPGGSSSGSAVSVVSNFSLISTGTDTGGSIRQPASFCGVTGLKPTYGAVSRYGVIAMASSLDSVGHFTHSARDSRIVFNVTKGEDGMDGTVKEVEYTKMIKPIIGLPKEYFTDGLDKEVEDAVLRAVEVYKRLGFEVKEVSLPHTKYAISVYYIVQPAEVSSNLGRYDGIRYGNDRNSFGNEAKRRIMLGTYVLSAGYYDAYYLKAMKVRTKIIEDYDKAFKKVDVLLSPVSPTPPFKLGEKTSDPLKMYLADVLTVSANLAGIPGLALPCGFAESSLPLGFQLVGPRFSENTLFYLGEQYQKETDWHLKKPTL